MKTWMTSLLFAIGLSATITGCVSTNVRGYTDQDYQGHKISKVAVRAPNAGFTFAETLERTMVEELSGKGIQAASFLSLFPPTREWTNQAVAERLQAKGFDAIMHVNLMGSDSQSQTVGYMHSGNAYAYGNMASYSGTSTPVTMVSRSTSTRVKIYDVATSKVIWVGDTSTQAGGLLYMDDDTQAQSIADEIVTALTESGHM